jgi:hypothetical protein
MNYQSDILIGLQNFNEGKTSQLIRLMKENYYDLCIKVNGGTEMSSIFFKEKYIKLKEIPYSILYNIDTYISDNCFINYDNLKEDIALLKSLNISLKNLYISNNAILITDNKIPINYYDSYRNTMTNKINNKCLRIRDLNMSEYYLFLLHNSVNRVDTYEFLKKYKKIILYQFLSFNNDIDYGTYYNSCFHCSSSFCTNIINFNTISNIYGICCPYDIYKDTLDHNKELDKLKEIESLNISINWLNLDNLIENININNINIVIFTKTDYLSILNLLKIYYKNKTHTFSNLDSFKKFLKEKINENCNIIYLHFIYNY